MKIQIQPTELATVTNPVGNYSDNFKATANVALDSREIPTLTLCDSSALAGYAYDGKSQTLFILTNKGAVYTYPKILKATFEALRTAESKGRYFNANIRPIKGTKIAENYIA